MLFHCTSSDSLLQLEVFPSVTQISKVAALGTARHGAWIPWVKASDTISWRNVQMSGWLCPPNKDPVPICCGMTWLYVDLLFNATISYSCRSLANLFAYFEIYWVREKKKVRNSGPYKESRFPCFVLIPSIHFLLILGSYRAVWCDEYNPHRNYKANIRISVGEVTRWSALEHRLDYCRLTIDRVHPNSRAGDIEGRLSYF